jgi:hypothetical protein
MVFVGVVGFFAFLFGSMVVSSLAGTLAGGVSRTPVLWTPLSLVTCVLSQTAYVSAVNLLRCLWLVGDGEDPFWDRYGSTLSNEWSFGVKFGVVLGVVGWVWCLKRVGEFTRGQAGA